MRDIDPEGRLKCTMKGLCWFLNTLEGGRGTARRENQLGKPEGGQGKASQPWATGLSGSPLLQV